MDDNTVQAYARLTAHEFFLEVAYANWFASMSERDAKDIADTLNQRMRSAYVADDAKQSAAETSGLQIASDAAEMAQRFLTKVESRASEIRAKAPRNHRS